MSAVAFDNTFLSVLLSDNPRIPQDPATGVPVVLAREPAEVVVEKIQKARRKIILPTPAIAELLTYIGPTAQQYVNLVQRGRVFEVGNFDALAAVELALLNRDTFAAGDAKNGAEPYQKIKTDRQIIAVCKVAGVVELYTDDESLAKRARLCGITPVHLWEIEPPEADRQGRLFVEQHDPIAEADADADAGD